MEGRRWKREGGPPHAAHDSQGRKSSQILRQPSLLIHVKAVYLFEHTPEHAARLVRALYNASATLVTFPSRGRLGKKEGTRECAGTRST